jgi:hypothetical protein
MLESLLKDNMDEIIGTVAGATESGTGEAQNFVTTVLGILQDEAAGGRLDLASLLRGDFGSLKDALSFQELGGLLGGGAEAGEKGVEAMMVPVSDSLQSIGGELGGIDGLLRQILGGDSGAGGIGGVAGGVADGLLGMVGGILGGGDNDDEPGDDEG